MVEHSRQDKQQDAPMDTGVSVTIGEDIKELFREADEAEWISLIYDQDSTTAEDLPDREQVIAAIRLLKSKSGTTEEFTATLRSLGECNQPVATCLLNASFEFLSAIDQLSDMLSTWRHEVSVINWRTDRILDSLDRMSRAANEFLEKEE